MAWHISSEISQQLDAWAQQASPNECCGLMFGTNNHIQRAELTTNISTSPTANFEIDPKRLIAAEKRNRSGKEQLIGYFHSHPNGPAIPSSTDTAMAANDGRVWIIIAPENITAWKLSAESKFLEQELVIGQR